MKRIFTAIFCLVGAVLAVEPPPAAAQKSRVVLVRDASAVTGFTIDDEKVREMVAKGVENLTGADTEAAAWAQFVSANDVVAVKIAPYVNTETVKAVVEGLKLAGVSEENIIVWDKRRTHAAQNFATVPDAGWDQDVFYEDRVVGKLIWGDLLFGRRDAEGGGTLSTRSHLTKIVTQCATKIINIASLRDHSDIGVSGCLQSLALGSVDNSRRFELAGSDVAVGEILLLPPIRDKVALHIMDGLIAQFAGGPTFRAQFSWPFGGIFFSRDAVAIDSLALELLESKRKEAKIPPIGSVAHINEASRLGLGKSSRDAIEFVEIVP
jgi:hypothetical protein